MVEVEKQLASLKRQASKARRYAELREEMRGLLRQVMASKALELDTEAERLGALLLETAAAEAFETQNVSALEAEAERLSARTYELDAELRQNQNLLGQATLELDRAENRIAFNRQRGEELDARTQHLAGQIVQAEAQLALVEERATQHEQGVATLREETTRLEQLVAEASVRGYETTAKTSELESRIAELQRATAEWGEQLHQLHADHAQAEGSLAHHTEALGREQVREHGMLDQSVELRERDRAAEIHLQGIGERAQKLGEEVHAAQARSLELKQNEIEMRGRCETLRDSLSSVRAKRTTLEQVLNDRAYTAEAVKKLFAANSQTGRDFHAVGLLADYAEVEQQYEAAIEHFLREELEYVIVETFDYARTGISMLREELGGRATFFVDSLNKSAARARGSNHSFPHSGRSCLAAGPAAGIPRSARRCGKTLSAAAEVRIFGGDSRPPPKNLARTYPAYSFVTPDGTTYQGRMVSGGRAAEAGPLGMKRELRALETETRNANRKWRKRKRRSSTLENSRRECEANSNASPPIMWKPTNGDRRDAPARASARTNCARSGGELSALPDRNPAPPPRSGSRAKMRAEHANSNAQRLPNRARARSKKSPLQASNCAASPNG